ncbi:hypothetical protein ACTSKR_03810 [Chitinibacteraceae bacterium HSL-7]
MTRSLLSAALLLALAATAHARDDTVMLPVADVLANPEYQAKLGDDIRFVFDSQQLPKGTVLGEDITNKKTNAANKSDVEACQWVTLSALLQLRERARALGADTVAQVRNFYRKNEVAMQDGKVECHAGTWTAGVALKATFVKTR